LFASNTWHRTQSRILKFHFLCFIVPEEFEEKKLKLVLKIWRKKAATFRLNASPYYQAPPTRDPIALIAESKKKSKSPHSHDADRTKLPVLLVRKIFTMSHAESEFNLICYLLQLKFEDIALREAPEVTIGGITAAAPASVTVALTGSQTKNSPTSPHSEPASSKVRILPEMAPRSGFRCEIFRLRMKNIESYIIILL
jgi:hypothetical protein